MLETKEQKQIFAGCVALIIILSLISFSHRPDLNLKNNPAATKTQRDFDFLNSQAYADYVKAVSIDQKSSQEIFETILTKEDIEKEVAKSLAVDQPIAPPSVDVKKIRASGATSGKAVNDYLSQSVGQAVDFNSSVSGLAEGFLSGDRESGDNLKARVDDLTNKLYSTAVPKDAINLHKSLITAFLSYNDFLNSADAFKAGDFSNPENDAFWPKMYKNYAVVNDSTKLYAQELNKLSAKYKIASVQIPSLAQGEKRNGLAAALIPQAHALFGIGDMTITIGDIPRIIMDGIKEGIASSFLQFSGSMLDKLITKIEQNYLVANFLYYSDALVSGQYADDFLNKYVNNSTDRNIVKGLLPQFNCGRNPNIRPIARARAQQYLGFEPNSLDPNDPNYYKKMAKVGDFKSSSTGWQSYFEDLASQTESQAQRAIQRELTSSGLKTPRDTMNSTISSSLNSIVSAQRAGFTSLLNLGISNADKIVTGLVSSLVQNLMTKFVFQGAGNGPVGVLKEQKTCVSAAVVNPVLALPPTQYQEPELPTEQSATASQCAFTETLSTECNEAILREIEICAADSTQHVGQLSCSQLATSPYVGAMLSGCESSIRGRSAQCPDLEEDLNKIVE